MGFKDIEIKNSYSSDDQDVLNDFYLPVLSEALEYKRLTGFFFSSSLAVAARGIINLIENNGNMKIISSAFLSEKDVESIKKGIEEPEELIRENMLKSLDEMKNEFIKNHIKALGWLVAKNKLKIKVAIMKDEEGHPFTAEDVSNTGIFHEKIGVLKDENGDCLSFSGSINETGAAWQKNIEEFKVFREWKSSEKKYYKFDKNKFNKFWQDRANRIDIIDVPEAIKDNLINKKPKTFQDLKSDLYEEYNKEKIGDNKVKIRDNCENEKKSELKLWPIQKNGRQKWFQNDKKGILQMATGSGKTYTALGSLEELFNEEDKLITVITCPNHSLVNQWKDSIKEFKTLKKTEKLIADSTNNNWRKELSNKISDFNIGYVDKLIILTTHHTYYKEDFVKKLREGKGKKCIVADEVHGVGSSERKQGLRLIYDYRLGLSATPRRWYDSEGTQKIYDYFEDVVFKFSLKDAIEKENPVTGKTYLTSYEYKPHFVALSEDEFLEYREETKKIRNMYHQAEKDEEKKKIFERLCIKRQEIIKNCENKLPEFKGIIENLEDFNHTLVYCNPHQIDEVKNILRKKDIDWHQFTEEEDLRPSQKFDGASERDFLLEEFENGTYDVLVAMKCLDEGIDVPPCKRAIILSSSGNPRQYIQRRGRVLRHYQNKEKAEIFDLIVIPFSDPNTEVFPLEEKILKKEIKRYKEFSNLALNSLECLQKIDNIEEKYDINLWGET